MMEFMTNHKNPLLFNSIIRQDAILQIITDINPVAGYELGETYQQRKTDPKARMCFSLISHDVLDAFILFLTKGLEMLLLVLERY
jgi:hypothetical protein